MPALIYSSRSGELKEKVAALPIGGSIIVPNASRGDALRVAAIRLGLRASCYRVKPGEPHLCFTILGRRKGGAK